MTSHSLYLDDKFIEGSHTAAWNTDDGSCFDVLRQDSSDMGSKHSVRVKIGGDIKVQFPITLCNLIGEDTASTGSLLVPP